MRNTYAVRCLLDAATVARDPLDATACRRAARLAQVVRWIWSNADRRRGRTPRPGQCLGRGCRQLIRRLSEEFPAPPEDAALTYLDDDEESGWMRHIPEATGAVRTAQCREAEDERPEVYSPFGDMEPGL